eukprot:5036182-Pyramimonas_sp.AAC.1
MGVDPPARALTETLCGAPRGARSARGACQGGRGHACICAHCGSAWWMCRDGRGPACEFDH